MSESAQNQQQDYTAADSFNEESAAGLERWAEQMDLYTGPDALLDFNQVDYVHIDLSNANPSGVAQLMMGRKTRLSTILREKSLLESGMSAARVLRAKIFELETEHGLDAGYFVAGTASWLSRDLGSAQRLATEKRFIAPILLAPLAITPHTSGDDFELRLTGAAKLNPALVRQLRKEYNIDLSSMDVAALANSMSRLDPEPVIDRMRSSTAKIPGMMIESKYLVSTFADLKESTGALPATAHTKVVRDLAALKSGIELSSHAPVAVNPLPPIDTRPVADEFLVADADASAQEVVDLASSGHSLAITSAPGTDDIRTALNIASTLMSQNKSVLIVGEKSSTLRTIAAQTAALGLGDTVFDVLKDRESEETRQLLIQAIVRNENAVEPDYSEVYAELETTRNQLAEHLNALKYTESRWGCSPFDAMQTLAALTAQQPAPSTHVRFNRDVMDALTDRSATTRQLVRLGELAGYRSSTQFSPWHQATLVDTQESQAAHELVKSLHESMTNLRAAMSLMGNETGMRTGNSLEQWNEQLGLLERIRETLKEFTGDIFERPVTDLIAATASGSWRRERGIEMSTMQRSRLRKAAKEYIRPGVHLGDIHDALVVVQSQREEWITWAAEGSLPVPPANLDELRAHHDELRAEFTGLELVLENSPQGNDFITAPAADILKRLSHLIDDEYLLHTLPERDGLIRSLTEQGLGELLDDLRERQIPAEHAPAELELAWWQTALEMMIASQEIEILDGNQLRELEARFRRADYRHIASTPARLLHRLAMQWQKAISEYADEAAYLKSHLRAHEFSLYEILTHAPHLATTLYPLWVSSPFAISRKIPAHQRFDTVILLDAESTPLAANLPAITRADQVIAFGDSVSGRPVPFMVSAVAHNAVMDVDDNLESTIDVLAKIVPQRSLAIVNRAIDPALFSYLNEHYYNGQLIHYPWGEEITESVAGLSVEYVSLEGRMSDNASMDSPSVEVEQVGWRVIEHAIKRPHQSLAVIASTARHAQRIADFVRRALESYPQAAGFFAPGKEPFRVVNVARAETIERDVVFVALGFGRAPHKPEVHSLGEFSEAHGGKHFVTAMTRARHETRIITSLSLDDMNPALLKGGALDIYRLIQEYSRQQEADTEMAFGAQITDKLPANEFLTNDAIEATDMGDWLLNDLVRRLKERGARVHSSENNDISLVVTAEGESLSAGAMRSPRARAMLHDGASMRIPLAVSSDGADSWADLSVRERTRLLPERLARTGWNYLTLWTIEVFSDPEAVVERMSTYLGMGEHKAS
ncbi:DNA helicase [Rothia sp. ZJ932]|uniref:DNA helicase n=1 Tax=Rothia sp. ZJ932 TaxID=2810516 RepID=UPI0019676652|nr:DNA helicase [Rothia sp. ZJ932]QRZ62140.1 DNA helicase [Rothia sp. ZJ932]